MIKSSVTRPVIRHSAMGKRVAELTRLVNVFMRRRVIPEIARQIDSLPSNWRDTHSLLGLRKRLRDEVKEAIVKKDDRAAEFVVAGQITDRGHEPVIALLVAIIDYLIDEDLRQEVERWG